MKQVSHNQQHTLPLQHAELHSSGCDSGHLLLVVQVALVVVQVVLVVAQVVLVVALVPLLPCM